MLHLSNWAEKASFSAMWAAIKELRAYVLSLRPIQSLNTQIQHTSNGTIIKAKPGGAAQAVDDPFLGEWSATYSGGYPKNAEVIIRGGTVAGYYKSLISANEEPPYNSSNWVQLANNNAIGNWT